MTGSGTAAAFRWQRQLPSCLFRRRCFKTDGCPPLSLRPTSARGKGALARVGLRPMVAPRGLTCWSRIGCTPRTPAPAAASAPPPPPPPPAPQIRTVKRRQDTRISGRPPRQRGLPMREAFSMRPDMHAIMHKTSYEKGVPPTGMAADLRGGVGAQLTSSGYQTPGWVAPSRTA
jgi:hypothetical protein